MGSSQQSLLMVGEDGFVPPPIPTCVPDPYYSCGPDGDPYWSNVGLLLHADGTNGQTTTVNAGIDGQTLTAVGSAVLSTTQKKWGPSSIFMPGNGSRFECAGWSGSQLGAGDFTIEFWFYLPTATASGDQWFLSVGSFGAAGTWMVSKNNTQGISFVSEASGGVDGSGSVVPLDQWYHVAICRVGTNVTLYRNGVVWNTGSVSTNFNNPGTFRVGSHPADNPGVRPAYIDDLRITKGVARYTGNFNIPAEAFPDAIEPSNAPMTLMQGDSSFSLSNPTPYTHRVVVPLNGSSSFSAARIFTTEMIGKKYIEFVCEGVGVVPSSQGRGYYCGFTSGLTSTFVANPTSAFSISIYVTNTNYNTSSPGYAVNGGDRVSNAAYDFLQGDVVCFALDYATGDVWVRINGGAWIGGGDPAAGTSPTHTLTNKLCVPYMSNYARGTGYSADFQMRAVVEGDTFSFAAPSGFEQFSGTWKEVRTVLSLHADSIVNTLIFEPDLTTDGADTIVPVSPYTIYNPSRIVFALNGATFTCTTDSNELRYTGTKIPPNGAGNITYPRRAYKCALSLFGSPEGNSEKIRVFYLADGPGFAFTVVAGVVQLWATGVVGGNAPGDSTSQTLTTLEIGQTYALEFRYAGRFIGWYVDNALLYSYTETPTSGNQFSIGSIPPPTPNFLPPPTGGVTSLRIANVEVTEEQLKDESCYQLKTVVLTESAVVSSEESKFGGSSVFVPNTGASAFNGFGIYDHQDFDFGTGDFTIECWAYRLANTYEGYLYYAAMGGEFSFRVLTTGLIRIDYRVNGNATITRVTTVDFPLNQWNFVVIQRRGLNFEFYLNGTLMDISAVFGGATSTVNSTGTWFWGRMNASSATSWNGYIDEVRVTRGAARYQIPQTVPMPTVFYPTAAPADPYFSNVDLLLNFEGANGSTTFTDQSSNNRTLSITQGTAVVSTADKYTGNSSLFSTGQLIIETDIGDAPANRSWTLEFWYKRINSGDDVGFLGFLFGSYAVALKTPNNGGNFEFGLLGTNTSQFRFTASQVPLNEWTHLAASYDAPGVDSTHGILRLFFNGQMEFEGYYSNLQISGTVYIGRKDPSGFGAINGYLDTYRLTRGVARYVASFDPASLPNCDSANDPGGNPVSGTAFLQGESVTAESGSIGIQDPWVALSSPSLTATPGNLIGGSPDRAVALTGQPATSIPGTATFFTPDRTAPLVGATATTVAGTVTRAPYPDLTSGNAVGNTNINSSSGKTVLSFLPDGTLTVTTYRADNTVVGTPITTQWIDKANANFVISTISSQYQIATINNLGGLAAVVTSTDPTMPGPQVVATLPTNLGATKYVTWTTASVPSGNTVLFVVNSQVTWVPTPTNPDAGKPSYFGAFLNKINLTVNSP